MDNQPDQDEDKDSDDGVEEDLEPVYESVGSLEPHSPPEPAEREPSPEPDMAEDEEMVQEGAEEEQAEAEAGAGAEAQDEVGAEAQDEVGAEAQVEAEAGAETEEEAEEEAEEEGSPAESETELELGETRRPAETQAEEPAEPEKPEDKAKTVKAKELRFRTSLPLTTIVEETPPVAPRPSRSRSWRDSEGRREGTEYEDKRKGSREPFQEYEDEEDYMVWSEEIQKMHEQQLRGELVDQYHALLVERNRYQRYNVYLQHRILEALRKKGLEQEEPAEKPAEPEAPKKEQAYLRYLAMLEELKKQEADDLNWYRQEVRQLKQQCREKQAQVEKEWRRFQALKKQVVMQVMGSCRMRGGRQAALREVDQIQAMEERKEKEMSALRLENVQLRQSLVHFETRMKAQEDLAEGLLLIDFEQLKIENQTFSEKVEERNEELLKLRNKVTSNVQIITHVKEKLYFMDMENACKKAQLSEIEMQVAVGRDTLTKTKQARDSLRIDNIKLNQKCGLLGKESLLRDLEETVDKTQQLSRRLESLKRHHAGLTMSCKGVRQKIREAKTFLPS